MDNKYFTSFPIVKKHSTPLIKLANIAFFLGSLAVLIAIFFCVPKSVIYEVLVGFFATSLVFYFVVGLLSKKFIVYGNLILNEETITIEIDNVKKNFV